MLTVRPASRGTACQLLSCWFLARIIFRPWRWRRCSSETSVDFQRTTQRYTPEDRTLHNHRCENLKSYMKRLCSHTFEFVSNKSTWFIVWSNPGENRQPAMCPWLALNSRWERQLRGRPMWRGTVGKKKLVSCLVVGERGLYWSLCVLIAQSCTARLGRIPAIPTFSLRSACQTIVGCEFLMLHPQTPVM
jgi:hypothetical protein